MTKLERKQSVSVNLLKMQSKTERKRKRLQIFILSMKMHGMFCLSEDLLTFAKTVAWF